MADGPATQVKEPNDWQNVDDWQTVGDASPKGEIRPAETGVGPWLRDLESDVRGGGRRTAIGRGLGMLQGRGDKGYTGLESGTSPETANLMGSMPLGAIHTAQGIQETPEHPVKGPLKALGGVGEMATIPGLVAGLPAAEEIIPSAYRAGKTLAEVEAAVGKNPVSLTRSMPKLEEAQRLSDYGHGTVTPLDNLYKRANTVNPIDFSEARSRYSALGNLTGEDRLRATPTLQRGVKQFNQAFGEDIADVPNQAGLGQKFAGGMKEYAQAKRLEDIGNTVKSAAKGAAKFAIPAGIGYGVGSHFLKNLIP